MNTRGISLRLAAVAAMVLLALIGAGPAFAQTTDANLVGAVSDQTGALVPGASIEAVNTATRVKYEAQTGAAGEYRINNLPVGTYDVTASKMGFLTHTEQGVGLELNHNSTVNFSLQVSATATTVEVTAAPVSIDTTTAQIQSTFNEEQIVNLPIIETSLHSFGALEVSMLSAGVASNGGVGQGTGPSVGGQRPVENNFMIEGVDNNNKGLTGPLVYVPTEATSEFTLLQNQYGAEFGHSTGGQFNTIIRSGSNQFHGSLYEYFQNRNLNALDQSVAREGFTSPLRYDQNKLGASFGGPIKKDKLFFFGNFEYAPYGYAAPPAAPVEGPTAAGYSMLNSMPGLSATNLKVLEQWVAPAPVASDSTTVNGKAIPLGILPIAGANFTNLYTYIASIDYNPWNKDAIRGRLIFNKQDSLDNLANLPAFYTTLPQRYWLATISDIHTFSPTLTNELRLGYNRFTQYYVVGNQTFPGLDVFPDIIFDDLGLQVGPDPNAPQFTVQNTYQYTDNVNWTKGRHNLKFGFDGRTSISPQFFIQRVRGDYDYGTLQEFLNDTIPSDLAERNLGNTPYYGNNHANYLYGNDEFRFRRNLTINLGLRWERTGVSETMNEQILNSVASVPGVLEFNKPATYNKAFAPRIGVAWSPGKSGTTSIRAGFGIGYDVIYDNVGLTDYPPQLSPTIDCVSVPAACASTGFLANGGIRPNALAVGTNLTAAQARAQTGSYIPNQLPPYSIQWNLGVQHVFHKDYTLDVRYLGTRGVHLLVQQQINKENTPVTPTRTLPTYLTAPTQAQLDSLSLTLAQLQAISPYTPALAAAGFNGTTITAFMPIGNQTYEGLATQMTRRFAHGLQFVGAYTWSHNIDDSTASHFSTVLTPRREEDFGNLRLDRSDSALDRRQRFTMTWLWETPWMRNSHNWAEKNLIGNWRFSGSYVAETGELATAQSGQDANLNGDTAGDRTYINPAGQANTGSNVTALKNSAGQTVAYLATNPNARYIRAGLGVFPDGGRNTLRMPGINDFDLSLGKRFNITERKMLEIRADAANAFNHPNFTPGLVNGVNFTEYNSGDRTYLEPQLQNFAKWNQEFPSSSRAMQLALRFTF
jgi:hypothetical protein